MRHLVLASFLVLPLTARADDWPQFRGPDRTGVSKEKGLLKEWPKGGPTLAWTHKSAGLGFSTVAIAKGVVYTLGTDMKFQDEIIIALDEKSGKELWTVVIGPIYLDKDKKYGDGPRSTPTVDGDLLFALGGKGELVCVDVTKKGAVVWRKSLTKDLGSVLMQHYGYSEAPLVDGDKLICTPGGPDGTMAALDKKTGNVLWRSKGWTDQAPYSSAVVADIHGVRQYIQAGYISDVKGGVLAGIEAKSGNPLWVKSIFTGQNEGISPTPIVKDNLAYMTAGFAAGCRLFEIDKKQTATDKYTKPAVKNKVKNTHGGVVLVGDHIYGHTETQTWVCQELATGSVDWTERNQLACKSGAITTAEGLLYLYTEDAEVGLVEASPKAFNLISSFTIPEKSKIPAIRPTSKSARAWAHPVIANGHLYVRDHELIFAFKITK